MDKDYKPNWDFFLTEIEEKPASVFLDLGLNKIRPVKTNPHLLTLEIEMNFPQENGLSSSDESEKLFEIEDNLMKRLENSFGAIIAGRVTTHGLRIIYFYLKTEKEAGKTIKELMKGFKEYKYIYSLENDIEWVKYEEDLYPIGFEMHTIMNRHIVEHLRCKGDELTVPREVDHYIFFSSESGKDSFLNAAVKLGYKKTSERLNEKNPDHPITLRVTRIDAVEYNEVIDYTSELYDFAEENDGVYDGWETKLVTTANAEK